MSEAKRQCYLCAVLEINNSIERDGTSFIQRRCKVGYLRACEYIIWAVDNEHIDINQLNDNTMRMIEDNRKAQQ